MYYPRMKLSEYLDRQQINIAQFARMAKIPQPTLWRIARGKVSPRPLNALRIEQATNGEVTRDELLYPELHERGIT